MIWFIFKPYLKVRVLKWSYSTEMVRIEVVIKFKILKDLNKVQKRLEGYKQRTKVARRVKIELKQKKLKGSKQSTKEARRFKTEHKRG